MSERAVQLSPQSGRVLHTNNGRFSTLTPVDSCTTPELLEELREQLSQALARNERDLVINLANTNAANGQCLEALLDLTEETQAQGGQLRISQLSPLVKQALVVTRLHNQLDLVADDATATEAPPATKRRLGDLLLDNGLLTQSQLEQGLAMQSKKGRKLGEIVIDEGWVSEQDILRALSEQLSIPQTTLTPGTYDNEAAALLPKKVLKRLSALPLFKVRDQLTVATPNPQNAPKLREIEDRTNLRVLPVFANAEAVLGVIEQSDQARVLGGELAVEVDDDFHVFENIDDEQATIDEVATGSPIINLANSLIQRAVREGVSDIHIEPFRDKCRVRFRIDGVLYEVMKHRPEVHPALVSRLKVMANLDIAERRLPQDGRIQVLTQGRSVDLRLSTLPGLFGEKMVLRVLDRNQAILDINKLGLSQTNFANYQTLLSNSYGLILVTGPTGSGKTTSLYAALDHLNSLERNIVTIEDPVEYQMDIINQNEVRAPVGLTFAKILKHVLRQDPDVIMVGEIRERETAEIAVQAALTGHLVLSTLHTNDSAGAITRMIDMGIEPYLLSSALIGVMAQRLVRSICPSCKTTYVASPEVQAHFSNLDDGSKLRLAKGSGCGECYDSGYRNRLAIHETLLNDDPLQRLIVSNPSRDDLTQHLNQRAFQSMYVDGLRRAKEQLTTIEEVLTVVGS